MNNVTYIPESVEVPANVGAFRMKNYEISKDGWWVPQNIPRIDCKKDFGDQLSKEIWVKINGAKYPWCFDLRHELAKIGGADYGEAGFNSLSLEFVTCNKDEPGFED